jgi:hypothetical protein
MFEYLHAHAALSIKVGVGIFKVEKKHIREPLTNYQLLPFWLTAIRNGFRNCCLNI